MTETRAVSVHVDLAKSRGAYKPLWNWIGYDEPNYTDTANGRKLLSELAELSPEPVRVRTHNLLTSGDGRYALKGGSTNAYTEDAEGDAVYNWTIMDRIFDAYVEAGNIPFVQVGFTPEALSADSGPYRHNWSPEDRYATITTGWASPPKDLKKWSDLIHAWARHLAGRFGEDTVRRWPWEVWNEPDGHYWKGTIEEFCAMYAVTVHAIKAAIPGARVGGPHTCGAFNNPKAQAFLRAFLTFIVETGAPIDFIAFHAKGNPVIWQDHVRMGLRKQLLDIEANLAILAEFPSLTHLPTVIGESDPEGCAACSARTHPQNSYRNGPLYGVYIVESMMRTYELSRRADIEIEGAVTWAFLFEEQPWFDGFRDLATNGVDKAVLNAFRMLGKLDGDWVEATSDHALPIETILKHGVRDEPDVNVVATRDEKGFSVLVWNYHDDDIPAGDAGIVLTIAGVTPGMCRLSHFRMDETHSNAFAEWRKIGSPQTVTVADYERLEAAGRLAVLENQALVSDGMLTLNTNLPRQGVSLFRVDY
jgi:xylan 1,4-beta-xylosidase